MSGSACTRSEADVCVCFRVRRRPSHRAKLAKQSMVAVRRALEDHTSSQQVCIAAMELVRNLAASVDLVPKLAKRSGYAVRAVRNTTGSAVLVPDRVRCSLWLTRCRHCPGTASSCMYAWKSSGTWLQVTHLESPSGPRLASSEKSSPSCESGWRVAGFRRPCLTLMRHACSCDVRRYSYAARMQVACNSALCNLGFAQENRDVINSGSGAVLIRASPLRVPPRDAERVQAYVSHSCLCVAVCGCVCP